MKFIIDEKIFEKFPGTTIGVVVGKGLNNAGFNDEVLQRIHEQEHTIRASYTPETLLQHPHIDAWRKTYTVFGAKPKKHACSVENLYRMVLNGEELRRINTIVDSYNYISLKYTVPVGGDDLDHVKGNIHLRFATGEELFIRLNSTEVDNPHVGEVIYADDEEVLCRRWNWRECDKSKMTEQSKNVVLVVEALPPLTVSDVQTIVTELGQMVAEYCGGTVTSHILNAQNSSVELS